MKTCKEMVEEFHVRNGSVINGVDNYPEVAVLRIRLMVEEAAETYAALQENNVVEAADGLTDLLYVVYGTAVAYGVLCLDMFQKAPVPPTEFFNKVDVLRFGQTMLPQLHHACDMVAASDEERIGLALQTLAGRICSFSARVWGLPMRELFAEGHRSNLTKTFAPASAVPGGKYGAVNPKGPGYSPPDIVGVLGRAREAFLEG